MSDNSQRLPSPPTARGIGIAITLMKTEVPVTAATSTAFQRVNIPAEIPDTSHIVQIYASTYGYKNAPIGWVAMSDKQIALATVLNSEKSSTGGYTLEGLQSNCTLTILYYVEDNI